MTFSLSPASAFPLPQNKFQVHSHCLPSLAWPQSSSLPLPVLTGFLLCSLIFWVPSPLCLLCSIPKSSLPGSSQVMPWNHLSWCTSAQESFPNHPVWDSALGFTDFCLHHPKLSFYLLGLLSCLLIVNLVCLCILGSSPLDLWLFTITKTLPMYLTQKLIKSVKRTILCVCLCIGSCVRRFMCVAALCTNVEAWEQPCVVFLIYHSPWCTRTGALTTWALTTSVKLLPQDLHATHRELRVLTQLLSGSRGSTLVLMFVWWAHSRLNYPTPVPLSSSLPWATLKCAALKEKAREESGKEIQFE